MAVYLREGGKARGQDCVRDKNNRTHTISSSHIIFKNTGASAEAEKQWLSNAPSKILGTTTDRSLLHCKQLQLD